MKMAIARSKVFAGCVLAAMATVAACRAGNSPMAANHMRWEGHEAVLDHAYAWQQQQDGHWVTYVLLVDRAVPPELLAKPDDRASLAEKAGAQALQFPVMSGGIPLPNGGFEVWFHNGDKLEHSALNGSGGFDIESLTADHIRGRTVTGWSNEKVAWLINFDTAIANGDAARMAAEGEALGKDGGDPGRDLLAAIDAERKRDLAALKALASPELSKALDDATKRDGALDMLQRMAPDHAQIVNGLRKGDTATVYWIKQWNDPSYRNMRAVDKMVFTDGKWRSEQHSYAAE